MKKPSKKEQLQENQGFRFKITNLKKAAYPEALTETDYYKIKIGDHISKGNGNTIYKVVNIQRVNMTDQLFELWKKENFRYGHNRDPKLMSLLEEYKEVEGYGVCEIHMKTVVRGNKVIANARLVKFLEPDNPSWKYNRYVLNTLQDRKNMRISYIKSIDYQINKFTDKKRIQEEALKAIESYENSLTLQVPQEEEATTQIVLETPYEIAANQPEEVTT